MHETAAMFTAFARENFGVSRDSDEKRVVFSVICARNNENKRTMENVRRWGQETINETLETWPKTVRSGYTTVLTISGDANDS